MKVIGIVNRVGIAPASNKPNTDSERSSCSSGWSSASSVHSNYTKSPEPKVPEQAAQKLQQTVVPASSSVTKKVIIAVTITFGIMLLIGGVLGGTLSHKGNEPTAGPTETTPSTSTSTDKLTSSTTSINTTTTTVK